MRRQSSAATMRAEGADGFLRVNSQNGPGLDLASLRPFLGEAERFYAHAKLNLFPNGGPRRPTIITVERRGRRKSAGWFAPARWQATGDGAPPPTRSWWPPKRPTSPLSRSST